MTARLQHKIALITAAGQGIGRAIAESFAAEGAVVVATDVDEKKLDGLQAASKRKLDVRSTEAVDSMARNLKQELGPLDILVNCAGYVHHGSVLDCSEQDWDFTFDLNVKSMHRTIKAFLPDMLEKQSGSIVNISSAVSSIRGVPDRYVYGASKAAIIGLTKAVAADFIRQGIRANAICPGTIESPSLEGRIRERSQATGKSLGASPWGAWANLGKWPRLPSSSPRMRQATSRAKLISWTAAWRFSNQLMQLRAKYWRDRKRFELLTPGFVVVTSYCFC
jgi:2-keto-3-deoxy-L-fuconate dehydrogenase